MCMSYSSKQYIHGKQTTPVVYKYRILYVVCVYIVGKESVLLRLTNKARREGVRKEGETLKKVSKGDEENPKKNIMKYIYSLTTTCWPLKILVRHSHYLH